MIVESELNPGCVGVAFGPIDGYPDHRVGDDGSVWMQTLAPGDGSPGADWVRLPVKTDVNGYHSVKLEYKGRGRTCLVHRLVLVAFVGPCPPGMMGCHAPDPDPANNRLVNLRWGTHKDNGMDRVRYGSWRKPKGLSVLEKKLLRLFIQGYPSVLASEMLGTPVDTVRSLFAKFQGMKDGRRRPS